MCFILRAWGKAMDDEQRNREDQEAQRLRAEVARLEGDLESVRIENLFLKTVFDGISEEIMVVDREFTVRDINRVMLERYGLDRQSALGRKCFELKEACGAPCHRGDNSSCPLSRAVETETRVETRYQHNEPGGGLRELSLIMYPILVPGEEGGARYFMEIARDETRYRNLIEQLRTSQRRFRSILDTATNAILSIDESHRITLFNNAAERIFGYSRDEVLGEDLSILIPSKYGDHNRYVQRFLKRRQGSLVGRTISLTALRRNREEFPIELSLSFLEMDAGITITAIIRDITERKRLEKMLLQSERLAAVGEAVAHVVHELKNPLMIIGGFTSQIQNSIEDERLLQKLGMIIEEVERVERLVGELGDFTKEYRLVLRQADVNSVLRDVVKVMGAAYSSDHCVFVESLDSELEEIACDPDKLKQVFINIIINGIEAMGRGGVITLNTERVHHGIEIRISDEGRGIPEEDLQHIFEPFFTTRERGSGLGLAISYKIIQAHGGEIAALNRPGRGATFVIRLPRA